MVEAEQQTMSQPRWNGSSIPLQAIATLVYPTVHSAHQETRQEDVQIRSLHSGHVVDSDEGMEASRRVIIPELAELHLMVCCPITFV